MPAPKKRPAVKKVPAAKKRPFKKYPAAKRATGQPAKTGLLYQFKVTLIDSHPPIWRRILVPEGTLDQLHEAIQTAMGWTNSHLHQFEIGQRRYGDPGMLNDDIFIDDELVNSRETALGELFSGKRPPRKILYTYDFGDNWHHEVAFEGMQDAEAGKQYPLCLAGKRACPPEDCGGLWGYANMLEAIRNPKHEDHELYAEWLDEDFDPEAFSADEATKAMRKGLPNWRDFG